MRMIENAAEFMRGRLAGRTVEIHTVGAPGKDLGLRPGVLLVAAGLALGMLAVPGEAAAQDPRGLNSTTSNEMGHRSITGRDLKVPTAVAPIQMGRVAIGQHQGASGGTVVIGNVVTQGDGAVVVIGNQTYYGNQAMTSYDTEAVAERNARLQRLVGSARGWSGR